MDESQLLFLKMLNDVPVDYPLRFSDRVTAAALTARRVRHGVAGMTRGR